MPPQDRDEIRARNRQHRGRRQRGSRQKVRPVVEDRLDPQQAAGRELAHADAPFFGRQGQIDLAADDIVNERGRIAFPQQVGQPVLADGLTGGQREDLQDLPRTATH